MASKFALVIANTEYQDASFAKLTAPGKDAEEFAHVLRQPDLAAFDDVQVLLNDGESKIRRSIARFFVDRKRDDLLLLYFSGHGIRNEQGQLFLAANDTEIKILEASGIPAEFVTQSMNNSRSQRQLLILDCCNSGAFAHGSKSASGVGKSMGIATAFEGSGFGRVVLTATDATQYAWEGDKVIGDTQKSVFTHFLIEGLKGDADRDGDGRIDVDELYDYAYEQVVHRTPKQTPGKWSYKQQGDIILRENLKPLDVKPALLPSELLYYLEHPSSGVRSTGVQELIRLLDGKHLGLARAAQEKLRELAENDDSLSLRRSASDSLIAHGLVLERPAPLSVEISNEEHREEKKIEKPARIPPLPSGEGRVRQKTRGPADWRSIASKLNLRLIGGIAGGLLIISLLIWGGSKLFLHLPAATPESTHTLQTNMTFTSQPEQTNTPSPSETSIPPTPTLGIGSTLISDKDGRTLLYVPAGDFTMGSDDGDLDERPVHTVYLDTFWIDKTEVTNAMYAKCVQDEVCNQPSSTKSYSHDSYYGNSEFDNYPVIYVSWDDAKAYCSWADRRLPTEAEWEKAASWDDEHQKKNVYPWGDSIECSLANYLGKENGCVGDTTPVGSYPTGISPYGALDMAGNVWEWVADWYDANYYVTLGENASNPRGPASGQYHVLRGGAWGGARNSGNHDLRSADRVGDDLANSYYVVIGFRCARSP